MNGDEGADKLSLRTIEALETRLRNLQQHLSPATRVTSSDVSARLSAVERVQSLNTTLDELSNKSRAVSDLLYFYNEHGEFLSPQFASTAFGSPSPSERLAIVNACMTKYPATVSQLNSLETLAIPPSDTLAALSDLHPRFSKAELIQSSITEEMAELRVRSATLLARWQELSILATGNCWAEWEGRLRKIERAVRHREHVLQEEKDD